MKSRKKNKRKPAKRARASVDRKFFGLVDATAPATPEIREKGELLYSSEKDLSALGPLARGSKDHPRDWHEELRRAGNMTDGVGFLTFDNAWDAVKELAQTKGALGREELISSLWRMYPGAAEQLGLPNPRTDHSVPPGQLGRGSADTVELSKREGEIWGIIQRGAGGRQYCRELDHAGIAPPRHGVWKDGPRKYLAAYDLGKPWRHRIEDEKSKIRQKAKAAKFAGALASE